MSPVFLFHMGVVIFVVGPAASKLDRTVSLCKMFQEVMIQEFRAIIRIEAKQGERERCFDLFDLFEDGGFPFSPNGSLFRPAGSNVDTVNGVSEHSGEGLAAMGNGVGFEKAGARFIPLVSFDRDMFSD